MWPKGGSVLESPDSKCGPQGQPRLRHVEFVKNVDWEPPLESGSTGTEFLVRLLDRYGRGWGGVVGGGGGGSGVVSEGRDGECLPIAPSCLHVPVTQELGTGTCDILFSGSGSNSLLIHKVFLLRGKSW